MKKLVFIFVLSCCFSCKNETQDVSLVTNNDEVIEVKDSIVFHKGSMPIRALNDKQLFFKYFKSNNLDSLFLISNQVKPNRFIADFNGDSQDDIAFFVRNASNNKAGLIFFHSPTDFFIFGAGNENLALDHIYFAKFTIDKSRMAYETIIDSISGDIIEPKEIKLMNIALHMKEEEGTSS